MGFVPFVFALGNLGALLAKSVYINDMFVLFVRQVLIIERY